MREPHTAIFAAGCFWQPEYEFRQRDGVLDTQVGYIGGHVDKPDYETVCTGNTGHAEAVKVIHDSGKISYDVMLQVFFSIHDPTQKNRQGLDIGPQYRSAIFYLDEVQRTKARQMVNKLIERGYAIQTGIEPAGTFWPAEGYHQRYLEKQIQNRVLK